MLAIVCTMSNLNQNHEFIVLKQSYTFQMCFHCEGTGRKERPFRKMVFVEDCKYCNGEGRRRFTVSEEVPVSDMLKDESFVLALKEVINQ